MQCEPAMTRGHPVVQSRGTGFVGYDVNGVGDEHISRDDRIDVTIVLKHPTSKVRMLTEQTQQLQPCMIDIVVLASSNEADIDTARQARHDQYWTRFVYPLSATTLLPVMTEAEGLARKATTLAISSGPPNRPFGMARTVASYIF